MNTLISSGDLMRMFLESDPNSIIRRPNLRRFARDNDIRYIITEGKWLIDYKQFFKKVNPRRSKSRAICLFINLSNLNWVFCLFICS